MEIPIYLNYAESVALNHPIGSGITEAACKTIVKQRLGQSGMQWKDKGAGVILSLRALAHSTGRWEQFWSKVNQCGLPMLDFMKKLNPSAYQFSLF